MQSTELTAAEQAIFSRKHALQVLNKDHPFQDPACLHRVLYHLERELLIVGVGLPLDKASLQAADALLCQEADRMLAHYQAQLPGVFSLELPSKEDALAYVGYAQSMRRKIAKALRNAQITQGKAALSVYLPQLAAVLDEHTPAVYRELVFHIQAVLQEQYSALSKAERLLEEAQAMLPQMQRAFFISKVQQFVSFVQDIAVEEVNALADRFLEESNLIKERMSYPELFLQFEKEMQPFVQKQFFFNAYQKFLIGRSQHELVKSHYLEIAIDTILCSAKFEDHLEKISEFSRNLFSHPEAVSKTFIQKVLKEILMPEELYSFESRVLQPLVEANELPSAYRFSFVFKELEDILVMQRHMVKYARLVKNMLEQPEALSLQELLIKHLLDNTEILKSLGAADWAEIPKPLLRSRIPKVAEAVRAIIENRGHDLNEEHAQQIQDIITAVKDILAGRLKEAGLDRSNLAMNVLLDEAQLIRLVTIVKENREQALTASPVSPANAGTFSAVSRNSFHESLPTTTPSGSSNSLNTLGG